MHHQPAVHTPLAELHHQPQGVTPCEGGGAGMLLVLQAGRVIIERILWACVKCVYLCLVRLAPEHWRCGRSSQQSFAPEAKSAVDGRERIVAVPHRNELRPPLLRPFLASCAPLVKAIASQQSMSCMKRLIEAERVIFRPKL